MYSNNYPAFPIHLLSYTFWAFHCLQHACPQSMAGSLLSTGYEKKSQWQPYQHYQYRRAQNYPRRDYGANIIKNCFMNSKHPASPNNGLSALSLQHISWVYLLLFPMWKVELLWVDRLFDQSLVFLSSNWLNPCRRKFTHILYTAASFQLKQ